MRVDKLTLGSAFILLAGSGAAYIGYVREWAREAG
jgi:hypothetical protein